MSWIVIGEEHGKIKLVSKSGVSGQLPKGAYLTIEEGKTKFILRVDKTQQDEPYAPSPLLADMDLSLLKQDQRCQNIVWAHRVIDISDRQDGLIDFIKPQLPARRSTQEEISVALENIKEGPEVFVATIHSGKNQILIDDSHKMITARLPDDMFFHQMLVCGKTGSGKTVATKYLAQYFVEKFEGAVLAVNVKDVDLLHMDRASETKNKELLNEWSVLKQKPHKVDNFVIYHPANTTISKTKGVTAICKPITLDVRRIDPESLTGLLQGISDIGAQHLPNIFRHWQEHMKRSKDDENFKFINFVNYLSSADTLTFPTLNVRGEESETTLHRGTFDNILRNLNVATDFFDSPGAKFIDETDILTNGKMSVIDTTGKNGIQFGSILLRDLLHRIVTAKSEQTSKVPILIVIDEVHRFYETGTAREALGDLDTICRTGRSQRIGVIFSSQNPEDMPSGLSTVINTKIFFKSDAKQAKQQGLMISPEEMESLKKGYAVASIHDLSQLKILKFPLAFAGVFEKGEESE
ncbi:MAG: DUF87 domain-containing protein [Candidatus Nanoarchaeia archaeon]|nr:DUF87 domain-containing protein [Candidatus Nanoarchaeia archaeon]MDD5239158.1 DUF87 domain-containing protein [Candidatus Nanoarchaeia archaeon]